MRRRLWLPILVLLLGTMGAASAQQRSQGEMVDQAVRDAEAAQKRDQDIVRRMSEEAAQAVQGAPTGAEAVGSTAAPAQATIRPPSEQRADLEGLVGQDLADRTGEEAGTVRGILISEDGTGALVMVELPGGTIKAVNAARILAAEGDRDGHYVDLDRSGIEALPTYRREGEGWAMAD